MTDPRFAQPYTIDDAFEPMYPESWRTKVGDRWVGWREYQQMQGFPTPRQARRLREIAKTFVSNNDTSRLTLC